MMKVGPMKIRHIAFVAAAAVAGIVPAAPAHAQDAAWRQKVAQLIGANYSYPRSAQLRGEQGSAKIKVAISPAGKVVSVDLVQSSGSAILDREAVRIPTKVAAYPPPPGGNPANVILPIVWQIEQ